MLISSTCTLHTAHYKLTTEKSSAHYKPTLATAHICESVDSEYNGPGVITELTPQWDFTLCHAHTVTVTLCHNGTLIYHNVCLCPNSGHFMSLVLIQHQFNQLNAILTQSPVNI